MGRKTKLTPEIQEELAKIIGAGHTHKSAYEYVGIGHDAFYRWMKKREFSETIKKAESKAKIGFVERVKKASEDTWQAAAWMLERRWPEEFAQRVKQEVSGKDGGPVVHKIDIFAEIEKYKGIFDSNGSGEKGGLGGHGSSEPMDKASTDL